MMEMKRDLENQPQILFQRFNLMNNIEFLKAVYKCVSVTITGNLKLHIIKPT